MNIRLDDARPAGRLFLVLVEAKRIPKRCRPVRDQSCTMRPETFGLVFSAIARRIPCGRMHVDTVGAIAHQMESWTAHPESERRERC